MFLLRQVSAASTFPPSSSRTRLRSVPISIAHTRRHSAVAQRPRDRHSPPFPGCWKGVDRRCSRRSVKPIILFVRQPHRRGSKPAVSGLSGGKTTTTAAFLIRFLSLTMRRQSRLESLQRNAGKKTNKNTRSWEWWKVFTTITHPKLRIRALNFTKLERGGDNAAVERLRTPVTGATGHQILHGCHKAQDAGGDSTTHWKNWVSGKGWWRAQRAKVRLLPRG